MEKLKVCLVSAVQTSFWGSEKKEYEKYYLPEMKKLADKLDFELCFLEEPIPDGKASEIAKKKILDMKPDFLMIQVSTFAAGEILLPLVDTGLKIGLWGVPEVTDNGAIPNNSFCGINMYGSIIKQYIGPQTRYKWFYGRIEDPMFIERFKITVSALKALKQLQGAKVALVGGIAPGFHDFYYDERLTFSKLGVRVNSLIEFSDIKDKALSYKEEEIKELVTEMKKEYTCLSKDMDQEHLENSVRVYKAFEDLIKDGGYDAVAISCWPKFRKELGIVVCSVIGRLLDHGYLAACEGDVDSVITMMILRNLSGQQPMLMDMSKFDEEDQSVLMWHCGSAPNRYADKSGTILEGHYKPGSHITCMDNIKVVGVNNMYYKKCPVTVARLTNDYKNMLVFSGEFIDKEDRSYDGSRGWVGNITSEGESIKIKDLVNTVLVQGYQHHYPIVEGNVEKELRELMAWLYIDPLEYIKYKEYMQNPTL